MTHRLVEALGNLREGEVLADIPVNAKLENVRAMVAAATA